MSASVLPTMVGPCRQVLIVEDEMRLRDMLAHAVHDMGFTASSARSGEQAARHLEQNPTDIVLLDLNLPGMHGIELLEIIHRRWPLTQAIVLTGFGDLES